MFKSFSIGTVKTDFHFVQINKACMTTIYCYNAIIQAFKLCTDWHYKHIKRFNQYPKLLFVIPGLLSRSESGTGNNKFIFKKSSVNCPPL